MSLYRFRDSVRVASAALYGRMSEAVVSGRSNDVSNLRDAAVKTADLWLTPELVNDYNPADFDFMDEQESASLTVAVEQFRQFAAGLTGQTPTAEQIHHGLDLLVEINKILDTMIGDEPDATTVYEAIRPIFRSCPEYIIWMTARLATDSTGDPAVWIWLIVSDDTAIESRGVQADLSRLSRAYLTALQRAGSDRWPYVSLVTRSDAKARFIMNVAA